jgi:hypothetical protein
MHRALSHHPDRYEIPIQARTVSRIYVESGFDIHFCDDENEPTIRVKDPIAVVTETARPLVRTAEGEITSGVGAFGKIVVSGAALRHGRLLEIVFKRGVRFWVDPEPDPTGWGPPGTHGLMLVCMPGSQMAIWFGRRAVPRSPCPVVETSTAEAMAD